MPTTLFAQNLVSLEAESSDVTLTVRGPERTIRHINPSNIERLDNCLVLLSSSYGTRTNLEKTNVVAIQVDAQMKVIRVINPAGADKSRPNFTSSVNIEIPQNGFVVLAIDDNYSTRGYKKFLAENFKEGHVVKLRVNDNIQSIKEVVSFAGDKLPSAIKLHTETLYTTLQSTERIAGEIINNTDKVDYSVLLMPKGRLPLMKKITENGMFSFDVELQNGTNYIDVILYANSEKISEQSLIIYRKEDKQQKPEVIMWVEQFPNAKTLTDEKAIEKMAIQCKAAGVTAFGLDVKGPEGYVSYKKNDLSKSPYFTATINPNKKTKESKMDLLESFVKIAHKHGLKVYTSFNFFTEGNVGTKDYAILKDHPEWEEIVQRPEDKGQLLKISESTVGKEAQAGKRIVLGFVNPANKEAQDFQLLRVEEVLKNYNVDGVILDRCRYDNLYADFSDQSKEQFSAYLEKQGKTLDAFPDDAFKINSSGKMVEGKYYKEWITFRSSVIKDFAGRVRELVDRYKKEKNPELKLASYVGSWFEVYWQNGVNWSSKNFVYDERLKFPDSRFYTDAYYQTSYTEYLDFLMIGTYYKTEKEVNKYITLGNILTNGELPLYGSMSLPDLKTEEQVDVFTASLKNSSGLMIFDFCYVDWKFFTEKLKEAIAKSKE